LISNNHFCFNDIGYFEKDNPPSILEKIDLHLLHFNFIAFMQTPGTILLLGNHHDFGRLGSGKGN